MAHLRLAPVAAALLLAVTAACGSDGDDESAGATTTAAAATATDTVTVKDFSFQPRRITVPAGTTVTWRFEDRQPHSVRLDDGSFESAEHTAGGTESHTFATAGEFTYKCGIHESMTGAVQVT